MLHTYSLLLHACTHTLQVEYSQPLGSCLHKLGEFHVNYTVQTNWTQPSFIRVQRRVIVDDIDECLLPAIAAGTAARTAVLLHANHVL
jgi:hypothetical protein